MLKKTTISTTPIHKKKVVRWESAKPRGKSRSNMIAEMMGIDVESNGLPIDNREEYGSSTSPSSPSSAKNVDFDGVSESMDEFE